MTDIGNPSSSVQQEKQHADKGKKEEIPIIYHVSASNLSPYTRAYYEKSINRFLAKSQIKDIEPLKEYSLQICKQMMIDYVIHLREKEKLSRSSIKLHLAAIHHFFVMIREDEFPIKWTKINIELPPNEYVHRDRGYTIEEIRRMLEVGCHGRLREKAVILLFTSGGGMRIGAIPKLKKCHLKEMSTSTGEKTYGIQIYAESSEDYFTPCSPECANIIDKYLEERVVITVSCYKEEPLYTARGDPVDGSDTVEMEQVLTAQWGQQIK